MATIAFRSTANDTWYDITFRYDPDLVDMIKTLIPSAYRKYDPNTHIWSTGKPWAMQFALALVAKGHNVVGITTPAGGPGSFAAGPAAGGPTAAGFFAAGAAGPGSSYGSYGAPPPPGFTKTSQPPPGSSKSRYWDDPTRHKPPPPMPPPPPQLTEGWARELMRRCAPEIREKVYKALAKVLHEDLGGDQRLMQELNDARNGIAS